MGYDPEGPGHDQLPCCGHQGAEGIHRCTGANRCGEGETSVDGLPDQQGADVAINASLGGLVGEVGGQAGGPTQGDSHPSRPDMLLWPTR